MINVKFQKRSRNYCVFCPRCWHNYVSICQYSKIHGERRLKTQIEGLKRIISDQNLMLLPEYEQRMKVLKQLDYIDENEIVQRKGKVACEVLHHFLYLN